MRDVTWHRVVRAFAGLLVVATMAAACGADATVTETTGASQPDADPSQTPSSGAASTPTATATAAEATAAPDSTPVPPGTDDSGSGGCVLDAATVEAVVGAEVVDSGLWTSANSANGLAASGCSYETADGTRYVIGRATPLDDPQASASLVFDELRARGSANASLATLGDGAFLSGESVFISDGGATFVVEVIGAKLESNDVDLLGQLAESLLAIDGFDARCAALPTLIPSEWQPGTDVLRGGGAADSPTGGFLFELCEVSIAAVPGANVSLRTSDDPTWFDVEREMAAGQVSVLAGLGAVFLSFDDDLLVRLGDRVLVLNGKDPAGDELDPATSAPLQDLAQAVLEAG